MHEATSCLPVSLDLNHRKQLGTLSELWNIVSPFCSALEVLILSTDQLSGLAELLLNTSLEGDSDTVYLHIMSRLIRQLKCKRLAMCVKNRDDSTGLQTRWSLLTELDGDSVREHRSIPISHVPKDECGGGSAWAAGLIHALHVDSLTIPEALRRADLLSALSQNTEGDFSRMGNFYFLLVALGQLIPAISNTKGQPATLVPLSAVVFMQAVKDLFEDCQRMHSDRVENSRQAVMVDEQLDETSIIWGQIQPGMVLKVQEGEPIPAETEEKMG
eukprot:g1645.t1